MTRRVDVRIPGMRVNETECRVLSAIASVASDRCGYRCAEIGMSYREIRNASAVCGHTVMRTCASLRLKGLLEVNAHKLANGGTAANTYRVTALGLEVIRMAEELGAFAE